MTEKRFSLSKDTEWWFVQDNAIQVNKYGYRDDLTGEDEYRGLHQELTEQETVDLLNELYETIFSLHKTIEELDNCQKGQSHRINDLYLENKQLKDLITHLGYTIKYDGYRHISLELKE